MRRLALFVAALLVVVSLLFPLAGHAQEPESLPPLVVFLEDSKLGITSIQDEGPDGISELARIFEHLGARTRWMYLGDSIPEEARVVVLVRPLQPIAASDMARLWVHMVRGNHLLLAIDPGGPATFRGEGPIKANSDRANAGLPTLLSLVYGVILQDTLVVEPWFTKTSIAENQTAHLVAFAENIVQHPVTEPLSTYNLPVQLWSARSMRVEAIGPHSYAVPLLYTQTAFGETNASLFKDESALLELNLGADPVGHLLIGALAENTLTGSRVVVLGDAEMVENGYGLTRWQGTSAPIHVANRLLTERLAAWLLDLPVEQWPTLPDEYTRLALDGDSSDWVDRNEIMQDDAGDALVPRYDIRGVRAFRDDRFLHVLLELSEPPNPDVRLLLGFENTFDGVVDVTLVMTAAEVLLTDGLESVVISDANMTVGTAIEVRLPLRLIGEGALFERACLADSRTPLSSPPIDCAMQMPVIIPVSNTVSPVDTWATGPRAIVSTPDAGVNLRAGPGTDAAIVDTAYNGQVFAVIGRTALGDWFQVQNAVHTGWLANFLIKINIGAGELPIVTP